MEIHQLVFWSLFQPRHKISQMSHRRGGWEGGWVAGRVYLTFRHIGTSCVAVKWPYVPQTTLQCEASI